MELVVYFLNKKKVRKILDKCAFSVKILLSLLNFWDIFMISRN